MKKGGLVLMLLIGSLLMVSSCGKNKDTLFQLVDPKESGIGFSNTIVENDSINVFEYMNIYTGAGVAVGDINNDGLTDVYFSGNMESGRLYLNKGNLKFEDITEQAGVLNSRWGTGVTMVDINQDGWLDIYVCVAGAGKVEDRANLLYINNGNNTFVERAAAYGLADTRQSMHAAFFDYDNDQDLDMYLLVNPAAYEQRVNISQPRKLNGESISNDRLYRNEGNGTFTDVTQSAGILTEGYGLGVGITDIDNDGWADIYVSNDFIGSDILYINQGDGTFVDKLSEYINHTSYAGMGNDLADIDNNGRSDIIVLDMRPEDNKRQKLIISSSGYDRFQMMLDAGYDPQYSRNTLQLNMGSGEFSEIGFMAGVSSTDWSWSPLFADYDNDGHKDLYVTNGFLRDLGNLDYIHYQNIYDTPLGDWDTKVKQKLASIQELPPAKLVNYAYRNTGNLTFDNVSEEWGMEIPSCSNGAAYADLDNDGDLDLLVNNVDQPAFLYENTANLKSPNNYVRISLRGNVGNLGGIGAKIRLMAGDSSQFYQHFLSRGYESAIDPVVHFGLGNHTKIDSLEIWWPDGSYQILTEVAANKLIELNQSEAANGSGATKSGKGEVALFKEVTTEVGVDYQHTEDATVDFKMQAILPHMHSRNGPGIAVADINNDGFDDFYVGGAAGAAGKLFIQNKDASFTEHEFETEAQFEDMGALFFDADGDGDQDLYVVSGGVSTENAKALYQDRLYLNDGNGTLSKSSGLPRIEASGSLVTAADFDHDGDLDLFVGGRVSPGAYPMPAKSFVLENRSQGTNAVKFVDVSDSIEHWDKLTMVTSALWTDYDNDGWKDLIAVGEFMEVVIFHNDNGKLNFVDPKDSGLENTHGWWNSLAGGDFDGDGDIDYLLGNLGLNSRYKASKEQPVCIYAKDYDKDGKVDPVMCYFIGGKNYLAHSRDEIISQINAMRVRFKTYESYSDVTFNESFLPEELEDAYIVKSELFESSYMENQGNGKFILKPLPIQCQMGPMEGIVVEDFDGDGFLDVLFTGNAYTTEVSSGRYDALKGSLLKGNGNGTFSTMAIEKSGFVNDWDTSGVARLNKAGGGNFILVANNDGPLKIFEIDSEVTGITSIPIPGWAISADIKLKNGTHYRTEYYNGEGYLSQNSRSILLNENIETIKLKDINGNVKTIFGQE